MRCLTPYLAVRADVEEKIQIMIMILPRPLLLFGLLDTYIHQ